MRRIFLAGVLCAVLPIAHAAGEPLPMWEIRSTASKGAVYLLGSVHVCRPACLEFSESVMGRFRSSRALAVELDPTRPDVLPQILKAGALPSGQTLSTKLSATQQQSLQKVLADIGIPGGALDGMRPPMAATVITMVAAQKYGLSGKHGVDAWFLEQARSANKPVRELETIERQLAALNAGSEQEQVASLTDTLNTIETGRFAPFLDQLIQAWQKGDLARVAALMQEGMGSATRLHTELFGKRNMEMAEKLATWLLQGEEVFVVMGAGHIAGEDNVAALLARKGFSIRQVRDGE